MTKKILFFTACKHGYENQYKKVAYVVEKSQKSLNFMEYRLNLIRTCIYRL